MPIPFRILDNRPVYLDDLGRPVAGGELRFYDAGTLNPKAVYEGPDLVVSNGPVVGLDSSGRTEVDTWGDGAYRVRLYGAGNVLISEADNVQVPGGASTAIPALEAGKFLTTDGSVLLWDDVRQVPDPTGQNGKVLGTDGSNLIWQALAAAGGNATVTFGAGFVKISDGVTAVMAQWGSDSISPSGSNTANKAFSYNTAFLALGWVGVSLAGGPGIANPGGGIPALGISSAGAAGAVANIDTNGFNSIVNAVPFNWFAIGTVAP